MLYVVTLSIIINLYRLNTMRYTFVGYFAIMNTGLEKTISTIILFLSICTFAQDNLQTVGSLPEVVSETSGLIYFNESLITHNDSGNEPVLFELDTLSLEIKRTITISNLENTDWEALTQDEDFIYIGDFGNNLGMRTDLAIYRISKPDYLSSNTVAATAINFTYVDQTDFSNTGNSDWDAEAFFVLNDQLIILTKQWQSQGSVAYTIPKFPGTYVANRVGTISDIGLITDATYDTTTSRLVVLGYSSILSPFIGVVEQLNPEVIFEGYEQLPLGLNFVQAEGIAQVSSSSYFFSSERFSRQNPTIESASRLFSFQLSSDAPENTEEPMPPQEPENPEVPVEEEHLEDKDQLLVFRDNTTNEYHYSLSTAKKIYGQMIFDVLGRPIWKNSGKIEKEGIISSSLETSIYYFTMYLEDGVIATPFAYY